METYKCDKCGMAVNANCAKCDEPLVNGLITIDDGSQVQVLKYPECEGMIKSPKCCGLDMTCAI